MKRADWLIKARKEDAFYPRFRLCACSQKIYPSDWTKEDEPLFDSCCVMCLFKVIKSKVVEKPIEAPSVCKYCYSAAPLMGHTWCDDCRRKNQDRIGAELDLWRALKTLSETWRQKSHEHAA